MVVIAQQQKHANKYVDQNDAFGLPMPNPMEQLPQPLAFFRPD
jgi:hypothetical protein